MPRRGKKKSLSERPPMIGEVIEQVWTERLLRPLPQLSEPRTIGSYADKGQKNIRREFTRAVAWGKRQQFPLEELHRACRNRGLVYASVYLELPQWVKVWQWEERPRQVKDRYGRILYMTKGKRRYETVAATEFSPLVRFDPVFPFHPNPLEATTEEKEERMAAFLNIYAATGLPTPSAQAVGVNYMQMLLWINESEVWQARFVVANESAKKLLEDVGRMRAIQGDSALLTFFVKHDNPDKYGRGVVKGEGTAALPEGVSSESVADALSIIAGAKRALPEVTEPTDHSLAESTLVDQTYEVEPDEDEVQPVSPFAPREFASRVIDVEG